MDFTNAELIAMVEHPIYWESEYCEELCKRAGIADEFYRNENDDGGFSITQKAIRILTGNKHYSLEIAQAIRCARRCRR